MYTPQDQNPLKINYWLLRDFVKVLPQVKTVSMKMADDLLHTHFPDLSDMVEDYEKRGSHHVYFLSDGSHIEINRNGAYLALKNGWEFCYGGLQLIRFVKAGS